MGLMPLMGNERGIRGATKVNRKVIMSAWLQKEYAMEFNSPILHQPP